MTRVRTIIGVAIMSVLLALYLMFAIYQAVLLVSTGEPLALLYGASLFAAPAIGVWSLWRELKFGRDAGALYDRYEKAHGKPQIPILPKRSEVAEPTSTDSEDWLIYGLTLDGVGKRREGRAAVRRALEFSRVN
ncbi:MAG: hypothetical protein ACOYNK_03015 [Microbacteriaceae bacterium]